MRRQRPNPSDVPGFNLRSEHAESVTDCPKCGDDAPGGNELCGECEAEEHMEQAMTDRMERGI